MMVQEMSFYKFEGTGNDFILIDDRSEAFVYHEDLIRKMCDRHFGIGADGLMLLRNAKDSHFEMLYYNSDGSPATFCGNGGRCMAAFARHLGIADEKLVFKAPDGYHTAEISDASENTFRVKLGMNDADVYEQQDNYVYLNTGTYHTVFFVVNPDDPNHMQRAPKIRYDKRFEPHGTNVNFVSREGNHLTVRTYEKGVESETLSCGTGVTASAIAASLLFGGNQFVISTKGGDLEVIFRRNENRFTEIYLTGPVSFLFKGVYYYRPS